MSYAALGETLSGSTSTTLGAYAQSNPEVAKISAEYSSARDSNTPGGAALQEAEKRDFGTSDEDLKAYASAAGAIAAAAGCSALGAPAAAPLCAWVGGKLGGAIYSGIKSVVGMFKKSNKQLEEYRKRAAELNRYFQRMESDFQIYMPLMDMMYASADALIIQHSQLFPEAQKLNQDQVFRMMREAGLPIIQDFAANPTVGYTLKDAGEGRVPCTANMWRVPFFHKVILSGDQTYESNIAHKCIGDPYWYEKTPDKESDARMQKVVAEGAKWLENIDNVTKTISSSLINMASNTEVRQLISDVSALTKSNAALAQNKDELLAQLSWQKQYEYRYLALKREAAAKKVAAEQAALDDFLKQASVTSHKELILFLSAAGVLLGSAGIAYALRSRHGNSR